MPGRAIEFGLVVAALVVAVTGLMLTRSGRPFGGGLVSVHKLVDLAATAALSVIGYRALGSAPLSGLEWTGVVAAGVLIVTGFATGGIVSARESAPGWALWTHRVGSWVALAAGVWCACLVRRW